MMLDLHPETLTKNGQDFIVLPYAEFKQIQRILGYLQHLENLQQAKVQQKDAEIDSLKNISLQSSINWENVLKELELENPENQSEKIKQLFDCWDQLNDEQEQRETLTIIKNLEKTSI